MPTELAETGLLTALGPLTKHRTPAAGSGAAVSFAAAGGEVQPVGLGSGDCDEVLPFSSLAGFPG